MVHRIETGHRIDGNVCGSCRIQFINHDGLIRKVPIFSAVTAVKGVYVVNG